MGGQQPGALSGDINLQSRSDGSLSEYWLRLSDYGAGRWEWHGPFTEAQVCISIPEGNYLSSLGNLFFTVVASDGAAFDVVGLGVNQRDGVDFTGACTDADGDIVLSSWDLDGNGTYDWSDPVNSNPPDQVYGVPYLRNVKFRVDDDHGAYDLDTVPVQILAPVPEPKV